MKPNVLYLWIHAALPLVMCVGVSAQNPHFVNVTQQLITEQRSFARSTAIGDVDGDGWPDIVTADNGGNRFTVWRSDNGQRYFIDPVRRMDAILGGGTILGDYDNDGHLDVHVSLGAFREAQSAPNRLYRAFRGNLVEVADAFDDVSPTDNAIWLDYDGDGLLDIYYGGTGVQPDNSTRRNRLLRNVGGGRFEDVTTAVGLDVQLSLAGGSNGGMVASDFDGDGRVDIYVGVFDSGNYLFLQVEPGRFVDRSPPVIAKDVGEAFGVSIGDIDNDGDMDLMQAAGGSAGVFKSTLLLNLGGGSFLDITTSAGLASLTDASLLGPGFGDVDNDGDLDLVTASPSHLFLNDGHGLFEEVLDPGLIGTSLNISFGDLDRDGDLDIVSGSEFGTTAGTGLDEGFRVYRNLGNDNHFLRVALEGTASNRSGIGSRVVAVTGDLRQTREISGGRGYEQDELVAHFGLGSRTRVDSLLIQWSSGRVDVMTDIDADRFVRVTEGEPLIQDVKASLWVERPPETLTNSAQSLSFVLQPAVYASDARIADVVADLSAIGGPEIAPLQPIGQGRYALRDVVVEPKTLGVAGIHVIVDQLTILGPRWSRISSPVLIVAAHDRAIYADRLHAGWQISGDAQVTSSTTADRALQLQVEEKPVGAWQFRLTADEPIRFAGYRSLQLSIQGVDVSLPRRPLLALNGVDLLELIDLDMSAWQTIEIPLDSLSSTGELRTLSLAGNIGGTLFLDDLRLVAPGSPPLHTVVLESRDDASTPDRFSLRQNYPNPFNPETTIRFDLPSSGEAELSLFNLSGQRVATLFGGWREAGSYSLRWDGRDDAGRDLASGMYFYRLTAGDQIATQKLLLLR